MEMILLVVGIFGFALVFSWAMAEAVFILAEILT